MRHDVRIEILRNGGRASGRNMHWYGEDQFHFDLERSQMPKHFAECARQLNEARFDGPFLDPDMLRCPCCGLKKFTIRSGLGSLDILQKIRDRIKEMEEHFELDGDELSEYLWGRFAKVDACESGTGFCSMSNTCKTKQDKFKREKHSCAFNRKVWIQTKSNAKSKFISRTKFVEGFPQVLGIHMDWNSVSVILNELAGTSARVYYDEFHAMILGELPSREECQALVKSISKICCDILDHNDIYAPELFNRILVPKDGEIALLHVFRLLASWGIKLSNESKHCISWLYTKRWNAKSFHTKDILDFFVDMYMHRLRVLEKSYLRCSSTSSEERGLRSKIYRCQDFIHSAFNLAEHI